MDWRRLGRAILLAIVYFAVIFVINIVVRLFFTVFGGMAVLIVSVVVLFIAVVAWIYNSWW